ncbi:WecB/TagA/CpsF family glycosyltransferase [Bacillus sp. FJAT-27245]|uniref:WecB/TagA/CpsF family glycosyltransferase n=1 Tax=Bacillus sp. FJAT-27245 TaxID=1684144 RepID=UPI0006A7E546|nr:WecB/TagA/CpsF family glycosyltransferase [Bacillus sp. FJAT-27245]
MKRIKILGSAINATNMENVISLIDNQIQQKITDYICVSNVHTVITGYREQEFRKITNNSYLTIPDGMPLSIVGKLQGNQEIERCTGPDLMAEMFLHSKNKSYTHFFYGNTKENLSILREKLLTKYPHLKIVGMYSPPFRDLDEREEQDIINLINKISPDIIWVGLGAPKQEIWMWNNKSKLQGTLMIGVGAAFNFHADIIKRAPEWMRNLSLEWFYRLLKEPKRLFKRYATTNFLFIYLLAKEVINKRLPGNNV